MGAGRCRPPNHHSLLSSGITRPTRAILLLSKISNSPEENKGPAEIPPLKECDLPALSISELEALWDKVAKERASIMREMGRIRNRFVLTGNGDLCWLNAARYAKHCRKLLLRAIERTLKHKRAEAFGEEFWNQAFFEVAKTKIPPDKFKVICQQVDEIIKHLSETGTLP